MSDMTPTSLATALVSRTGKIIKNVLRVFERGKICYKMAYYTLLYYTKLIFRNRVTKLECTQTKN